MLHNFGPFWVSANVRHMLNNFTGGEKICGLSRRSQLSVAKDVKSKTVFDIASPIILFLVSNPGLVVSVLDEKI